MAKAAAKPSTSATGPRKPRASRAKSAVDIEKASESALQKLQELGIEDQLQHDIEWCLGSYRADRNPVGLYEYAGRALAVLKNEKEKKTKGVTAKLINELESVMKAQS